MTRRVADLTENDVVSAVCGLFESTGGSIEQQLTTTQRDIAVLAPPT